MEIKEEDCCSAYLNPGQRNTSVNDNHDISDEGEPLIKKKEIRKPRLINNKFDLIILLSMAAIYGIGACAFTVIAPFFGQIAKQKGVSDTVIGLIFTVYPLVIFLVSPIVGKMIPKIGTQFSLYIGCFIGGTCEILFGFVEDMNNKQIFIMFCFLIRIATAVGTSFSQTAMISIVTLSFKDNLSTMFGVLELLSGFGAMAGPALGGVLFKVGGFKLPFIVIGSTFNLVLIVVAFVFWKYNALQGEYNSKTEDAQKTGSVLKVMRVPGIVMLSSVAIMAGIVLLFLDPVLANHLIEVAKPNTISSEMIGLIFFVSSLSYAVMAPIIGLLIDKKLNGRFLMVLGQFMCGLCYLFIGPSPLFGFITSNVWVVSISYGLLGIALSPMLVPLLSEMTKCAKNAGLPDDLATTSIISGIFNSANNLGDAIGPTLGGYLTGKYSFVWASTIFGFAAAAEGMLLLLFTVWERNSKWSKKKHEKKVIHSTVEPC